MEIQEITTEELKTLLMHTRGSTPIAFTSLTEAQKSKAKNAEKVFKLSKVGGLINYDYGASVNRQLSREDKKPFFETAGLPKWAEMIHPSVIRHTGNGTFYIRCKVQQINDKPLYFYNGKQVERSAIESLLKLPSKSKKQEEAGIEKQVIHRNYKFDSIQLITIGGKRYKIMH